ncbi:MAG: hypothetical protein GX495_12730 [Chloroflexi bacterium]|nr:hypothetical protein [Chloroflexota bacterium]
MELAAPSLDLLHNHIDITHIPFSDRGSRLLVWQSGGACSLQIKLAERLTTLEADIEAYLRRPPYIHDMCLVDGEGESLPFDVESSPDRLVFHTRIGDFQLVFQDRRTISFGLPAGQRCGLRFHVSPQYFLAGEMGGTFKAVRNLDYLSNAPVVRNRIIPEDGGYRVVIIVDAGEDAAIALKIYPDNDFLESVVPFSKAAEASSSRWRSWFERVPAVNERYQKLYAYSWWVMANNLLSPQGNLTFEAMMPSKIKYVGLWAWDSALHALAYRHIDAELARNQIRAMLAHQFVNGMVPDAIYDEGIVATIDHPIAGEVTKPPTFAWAALKLHEADPDFDFLREIYVPLARLNAWWFTFNDDDGDGIVQYNHPYSSGLDDSPMWDYGMPVEAPDINTYLCIQMQSLSTIADLLGMRDEAAMWRRRSTALVRRMIKDLWDEESGLFWVMRDDKPVRVVTPFNLYPLWTGQLPGAMNERLVQTLTDPDRFWGEYRLPSVAYNDPHYSPDVMWRGPVWANVNYFFIEALQKVDRPDLARELRKSTLELINRHRQIAEYYDSQTGEIPGTAAEIFGWTAAVFIDLAIQESRELAAGEQLDLININPGS